MNQIIQIIGSLLVLAGFALSQAGLIDAKSAFYLAVNAVGSAILSANALIGHQWGFLILESAWAAVSLTGLLRRRTPQGSAIPAGQSVIVKHP